MRGGIPLSQTVHNTKRVVNGGYYPPVFLHHNGDIPHETNGDIPYESTSSERKYPKSRC